jgi:hypothetical protein
MNLIVAKMQGVQHLDWLLEGKKMHSTFQHIYEIGQNSKLHNNTLKCWFPGGKPNLT